MFFSNASRRQTVIEMSEKWEQYLQLSHGVLEVGRNKFVCTDCATEKMTHQEIMAHLIIEHYQPNHSTRYPDFQWCHKLLNFPQVKKDWLEDLKFDRLLKIGELMPEEEKQMWKMKYPDMLKLLRDKRTVNYTEPVDKQALINEWRKLQPDEADDGTVKMENGELRKDVKTAVYCPGFNMDSKSEGCIKMQKMFATRKENVSKKDFSFWEV